MTDEEFLAEMAAIDDELFAAFREQTLESIKRDKEFATDLKVSLEQSTDDSEKPADEVAGDGDSGSGPASDRGDDKRDHQGASGDRLAVPV